MSAPQGTAWPNVLADLEAKRNALTQMIDIVRMHFVGADPTEMPASPIARPNGNTGKKRNKQTNKQTNKARGAPSRATEPP